MTDVWNLGVVDLVSGIKAGRLEGAEVVRAFASRAQAVDEALHCFVEIDQGASARAQDLERNPKRGPLHGIPYAYKDVFAGGNKRPTVGTRAVSLPLRAENSTVLDRLDGAGAVSLGSLNLDPFGYAATGANPEFGTTRNPWDATRISGGSSGGAAAAVAAGAVPFAIGTDAGGSIRIPAALCGVTGLKPTFGRISRAGAVLLTYSQDTVGIIARTAREIALVLEHVAGHDDDDAASIPAPVPAFARFSASYEGIRVGFDRRLFADRTSIDIADAAESALTVFATLGAQLVEVDLSFLEDDDTAATVLTWAEAAAVHGHTLASEPSRYPPAIRARLEMALAANGADHVDAMRLQGRAISRLLDGPLAEADVLLAPTVAGAAVAVEDMERDPVAVSVGHLQLNRPFNLTGVPALALPVGFDDAGLPLGVQLVSRPWAEERLLSAAAAYQEVTDWHHRRPALRVDGTV